MQTSAAVHRQSWSTLESHPFITPQFRYFAYSQFLKDRLGATAYRVTIDAGFTCPTRDGRLGFGGCTYCRNDGFSPASSQFRPRVLLRPSADVHTQITASLPRLKRRYHREKFLAYFQSYTNTYGPVDALERLYREALDHPDIIGLIVGTRPDCIDEARLALLEQLASEHYVSVEYGCESVYDRTLAWVQRGHDYACFADAVESTAGRGIDITAHIILGFPTETRDEMRRMATTLSALPIDCIKIHNLHIVAGTVLAHTFQQTPFPLFTLQEYVEVVADFLERLSPRIAVQRLYGDAPPALLIAPAWRVTGTDMSARINRELARRESVPGDPGILMTERLAASRFIGHARRRLSC